MVRCCNELGIALSAWIVLEEMPKVPFGSIEKVARQFIVVGVLILNPFYRAAIEAEKRSVGIAQQYWRVRRDKELGVSRCFQLVDDAQERELPLRRLATPVLSDQEGHIRVKVQIDTIPESRDVEGVCARVAFLLQSHDPTEEWGSKRAWSAVRFPCVHVMPSAAAPC